MKRAVFDSGKLYQSQFCFCRVNRVYEIAEDNLLVVYSVEQQKEVIPFWKNYECPSQKDTVAVILQTIIRYI